MKDQELLGQPAQAPDDYGQTVRQAIRRWGPMAAVAAAAIPAMILMRGKGGKELLSSLKRVAPEHVASLEKSPFPYILTDMPGVDAGMSIFRTTAPPPEHDLARMWRAVNERWPQHGYQQSADFIKAETGKVPTAFGDLRVGTQESPHVQTLPTAVHELGHAAGFERTRQQFPNANIHDIHTHGALHQDRIPDPKTRQIIADEMTKSPTMEAYAVNRLMPPEGERGYKPLGEILTEIWANRMMRRSGIPFKPLDAKHYTGARYEDARREFLPVIRRLQQTGHMDEPREQQSQRALQQLLESLKRPQATYYPYLR